MKVDVKKLVNLLELASVDWMFEPVVVEFAEGGGVAFNMDPSMTVASYVTVPTSFASAYEPVGRVVVDESLYKKIKRYLKGEVDVKVQGGKLIIRGPTDVLEVSMPVPQGESQHPDFQQTEDGVFAKKIGVRGLYVADISPLSDVTAEDTVTLKFSQGGVVARIGFETGALEKVLMLVSAKKTTEAVYTCDARVLRAIAGMVSGPVTIAVPEEESAPLQIYYADKVLPAAVTYVLAPRVVT